MSFSAIETVIFFVFTAVIIAAIPLRFRLFIILVLSFGFALTNDFSGFAKLLLLCFATFSIVKLLLSSSRQPRVGLLYVGVVTNVVCWFLLKGTFTSTSIATTFGLSYVVFQNISFLSHYFHSYITPPISLYKYLVYILYYPKIVAGPIVKFRKFAKDIADSAPTTYSNLVYGSRLVLWGCFKKFVIADRAVILINNYYGDPSISDSGSTIIMMISCAIYLYGDFSGYSDIVIGVSNLMGIPLEKNFDAPFFARSFSDFWRRWHISLGNWFSDFLFKPLHVFLQKNFFWLKNKSIKRAVIYLTCTFVTFMTIAFWHGNQLNFFMFGLVQCAIVFVEFFTSSVSSRNRSATLFSILYVFTTFSFCAALLLCKEIHKLQHGLVAMFYSGSFSFSILEEPIAFKNFIISTAGFTTLLFFEYQYKYDLLFNRLFFSRNAVVLRWFSYVLAVFVILCFGSLFDAAPFLYKEF